MGRRLLFLDERPAFELSFWCGTCPLLFKRLADANATVSLGGPAAAVLEAGLDDLDEAIVRLFAQLLPRGQYLPLLLDVEPQLRRPVEPGDYFSEEQVATWGIDRFWDLPEYPQTPYYRTFETDVGEADHLFEFIVPMVPPSWNDSVKVAAFAERLEGSSRPTAVAVSVLDICQPAEAQASDYYAHWGLTHFLLDGHHKVHAAAEADRALRLLSLVSVDASLAARDQVAALPELRARRAMKRGG